MWAVFVAAAAWADDGTITRGGGMFGVTPRYSTVSSLDDSLAGFDDLEPSYLYTRIDAPGAVFAVPGGVFVVRLSGLLGLLATRDNPKMQVQGTGQGAGHLWDQSFTSLWTMFGPSGDQGGFAIGPGFDAGPIGYGRFSGEGGIATSQKEALQFNPGLRTAVWYADEAIGVQAHLGVMAVRTKDPGAWDGFAVDLETPVFIAFGEKIGMYVSPIGHYQRAQWRDEDPDPERLLTGGAGVGLVLGDIQIN